MKAITQFINNELKPRLYDNIPSIFPELDFKQKGNKWASPLHYDGSEGTGRRDDRCVVTRAYPYTIYDQTKGKKDIIELYKENNGYNEIWEAVNALCRIVGIPEPEYTPEAKEEYRKSENRRNTLELSLERQKKALFAPEGEATLKYILSRGWTEEEVKKAELGYISPEEAKKIDAQRSVGDFYTLSIPLRSGSLLYGFKFRTIQTIQEEEKKGKYAYLRETKRELYNLTGVQQNGGDIVVVEGELDALHAEVRGIPGIVATSGGGLTDTLLKAAIQRGISRITLLFDRDKSGAEFVKKAIQIGYKNHISVLVATYPEENLPDGTMIHDIDEYLRAHSPEDLKELISNAQMSGLYLLECKVNEAVEKNRGEEDLKATIAVDLRNEVIKLANSTPDQTERDLILTTFAKYTGEAISKEALQAVADEERATADKLQKKKETEEALRKADSLYKEGKVNEALNVMGEAASTLKQVGAKEKYSPLLGLPSEDSLSKRIQKRQGDIPTDYELISTHNEKERFTLPSGAITFVVAPTSHGKSTMIQNLALQVAKSEGEGTILYFSFEEDAENVTLQLLNKYIGEDLCNNYDSRRSNNLRAIAHYYKTGEERFIKQDKLPTFRQKKAEFFSRLYDSGKLRIYYEDYDSTELIEAIRYIASQTKVKAVFIDYVQLLSKKGNRKQRTEELKEICKDLKDLSIQTQLPIIVAAQSNREVTSPLEMHSQKIAEAADLERIANKILFIWNSSFVAQKSKDSKAELEYFETSKKIKLGESGKIYAKLTKNRGGVVNIDAVLSYNGNTGVISPNSEPQQPEQGELNLETPKKSECPF